MPFSPKYKKKKKRSKRKCVSKMRLTLCHREYSRARTAFSGMTRCRDRSSPVECKKASNSIFVYSWHWFHSQEKNAKKQNKKTCWCECARTNLYWTKQQTLIWDSSICPSYNSVTTLQMNLEPSPTIITNQYQGAGKYKDSASSFFFF